MTRGPWYISAAAVRDYLGIMRRPIVEYGPEWNRAEDELIELATKCASKEPRRTRDGYLCYRGPRPHRLQLVVSDANRAEGDLPQLVAVKRQTGN